MLNAAALARHPVAVALLVALSMGGAAASRAAELTEIPLENLLETEVISAARFARQVTDASSAVSVLNAEDIRTLGLRTFGEVLDQMRGLHVSHSFDYVFLGARGIGGPLSLAGRVLLLIDGIPAVDNLYDQLYLGHDGVLDMALIERIEYAPGSGTAMYGNNAFLGVINVVTKRGRDIDGLQASVSMGDWNERTTRLSWGQRLSNGAEFLLSGTAHANTGLPSAEMGDLIDHERVTAHDQRLFFKGTWNGFIVEAMGAQRRRFNNQRPDWYDSYLDRNEFVSLGHDGQLAEGWRSSVRLHGGRYGYHTSDEDTRYGYARLANTGEWWALESQFGYDGLEGHRIVLGSRLRRDPLLRYDYLDYDGAGYRYDDKRRSVGLSAEDEITLSPEWRATAGLRLDRRTYAPWTWSPRGALVWQPAPAWEIKLSQGRATRFPSTAEMSFGELTDESNERVTTRELVAEYKRDSLRLLGSYYRYRITDLIEADDGVNHVDGRGLEFEAEWQWRGWRLRGSQAWQHADADAGPPLRFAPRTVTKVHGSVPLGSEAWRLGASLRRTGTQYDIRGIKVNARTLVDLTLASQKALGNFDVRVGWRNVLARREPTMDAYYQTPPVDERMRSAWIELTGTFQ